MKTLRLILLSAFLVQGWAVTTAHAQARRYTRRVPNLPPQPAPPQAQTNAPAPQTQAPPAAPATDPSVQAQTPASAPHPAPVRLQPPPPDPEKVRANKEEAERRRLEFQKKRAEEGSESAQYELGVRYLKGDGVEKDEATGRKWLEESAKNGFAPAAKKLEEMNKPTAAPKPDQK